MIQRLDSTSLRRQLFWALVAPAIGVIFVIGYFADLATRRALEDALGERLSSIAEAAATLIGPRVLLFDRGDEEARVVKNSLRKLETLREATHVERIFVVRFDRSTALLDTARELKIGDVHVRARFDRLELEEVQLGKSVASVLFDGPDGRPFKTGYAPLYDGSGRVEGYVGVNAHAAFFLAIDDLRTAIGVIALFGFLLLAFIALVLARRVSVPLSELSQAALRIGEGELDTPIPTRGPKEAVVLADTMRSMARSLKTRDEEMQMMLQGIAHEVRNPLGGIELFGGLLYEDLDPSDPRRKHVEKIIQELRALSRVVNNFLDFARHASADPKDADLRTLIEEVIALSVKDAEQKKISIEFAGPSVMARIDSETLKRALLNLLRNAIQASPERGGIRIQLSRVDHEVAIAVEDKGPGVPMEKREQIFKPFFTTKQQGTGLGLALVKKAADAHGGHVRVEDVDGGGARFVLVLPSLPERGT